MKKILLFFLIIGLCPFLCSTAEAKKKQNTPYQEYKYQQKVLRRIEKEKYQRSLLPFSGFQTVQEYEQKSKDVPTSQMKIPDPKLPKDIKMQYVPQPTYKLTRYNNPPGTPEISIKRYFYFDRQENGQGIASPDRKMLVYPSIYYYAIAKCTACDLFVIPLDTTVPDVDRILRANVANKLPNPILSTDKSISEQFVYRTMTPIDFSPDGSKLIAKEKIGYTYDGIWQTNLWVYDFDTKTSKQLVEVRDAIKFYWYNAKGIMLEDKRWDIYPLGFDADDENRIVVAAYGFTGKIPKFLGTWSVDYKGERTLLVSLFDPSPQISINGFKVVRDGIVNPTEVMKSEKEQDKIVKKARKTEKKELKTNAKAGKKVYKATISKMKKEEKDMRVQHYMHQRVVAPTSLD